MKAKYVRWNKVDNAWKHSLSSVTQGLLHSINTAQQVLTSHYIDSLSSYFNEDGTPTMFDFQINEETMGRIPLLALTEPKGLTLKEVEMDLAVRIDDAVLVKKKMGKESFEDETIRGVSRESFEVSFASTADSMKDRTANIINIKLKFEEIDNPEGVSRIMDEFKNKPIIFMTKKEWEEKIVKEAEAIKAAKQMNKEEDEKLKKAKEAKE